MLKVLLYKNNLYSFTEFKSAFAYLVLQYQEVQTGFWGQNREITAAY